MRWWRWRWVGMVTFLWLCPLALGVPLFSLQLLLPLLPAPHLLLAHFQEQRLFLVLIKSVEHIGVDVHVLQNLLQHVDARAAGSTWYHLATQSEGGGAVLWPAASWDGQWALVYSLMLSDEDFDSFFTIDSFFFTLMSSSSWIKAHSQTHTLYNLSHRHKHANTFTHTLTHTHNPVSSLCCADSFLALLRYQFPLTLEVITGTIYKKEEKKKEHFEQASRRFCSFSSWRFHMLLKVAVSCVFLPPFSQQFWNFAFEPFPWKFRFGRLSRPSLHEYGRAQALFPKWQKDSGQKWEEIPKEWDCFCHQCPTPPSFPSLPHIPSQNHVPSPPPPPLQSHEIAARF